MAEEIRRRGVVEEGVHDRLGRPFGGWMLGDVERDEAPTMVVEHDQDEEHAQARGGAVEKSRETRSRTAGCAACSGWNFSRPGDGSFRRGWSTSGPEGEDDHQERASQVRPQKPEGVVSNLRRSLNFSRGWPQIVEDGCLRFLKGHR